MSGMLERAILEQLPGATKVHFEGEFVFVRDEQDVVTRYRLSKEAQRLALLEREGRPRDIQPGEVLLVPPDDTA